jgi:hypothetical protein
VAARPGRQRFSYESNRAACPDLSARCALSTGSRPTPYAARSCERSCFRIPTSISAIVEVFPALPGQQGTGAPKAEPRCQMRPLALLAAHTATRRGLHDASAAIVHGSASLEPVLEFGEVARDFAPRS